MTSRADFLNQQFFLVDGDYPGGKLNKHRKMCNSPFVFLRGSAQIFYADIAAANLALPAALHDVPFTTIMGDCHVSNFGFFTEESSHGDEVVFSLNDFDDACIGHASWDILRFLVSLFLTVDYCDGLKKGLYAGKKNPILEGINPYVDKLQITPDHATQACKQFILSYQQSLVQCMDDKKGSPPFIDKAFEDFASPSCLSKRFEKAKSRAIGGEEFLIKSALSKAVDVNKVALKFMTSKSKFTPLGNSLEAIKGHLSPYFYHDILDIVYRVESGTGSVNMPRLYLLIGPKHEASIAHCHIVEVKQQRTAAPLYYFSNLHAKNTLNPAHLTFKCQRIMQRCQDRYLDEVEFEDAHWLIRSRHHAKVGIDPEHIGFGAKNAEKNGFENYARACAQELAKAHSRNDLIQTLFEEKMHKALELCKQELTDIAIAYAEQVKSDWRWLIEQYPNKATT
ncbi:DUF2252 family protein [Glaciecola petra]|uniref:DUF2252 family protein n=1 Tax=Glaciecola petra TaxID=3075602 RepID=A0ABU2ZTS0_9ALTE|nr:DUF2252 family protein [Aestuariibacter sp. P117]MDT0596037.1 DUF2252 family protein [Aestuariibacter sp. P117]